MAGARRRRNRGGTRAADLIAAAARDHRRHARSPTRRSLRTPPSGWSTSGAAGEMGGRAVGQRHDSAASRRGVLAARGSGPHRARDAPAAPPGRACARAPVSGPRGALGRGAAGVRTRGGAESHGGPGAARPHRAEGRDGGDRADPATRWRAAAGASRHRRGRGGGRPRPAHDHAGAGVPRPRRDAVPIARPLHEAAASGLVSLDDLRDYADARGGRAASSPSAPRWRCRTCAPGSNATSSGACRPAASPCRS